MRNQFKCSECRRKKIKCNPSNREWETTQQKCNGCKNDNDAPCGPNYKKSDDPAVPGHRNEGNAHQENAGRHNGGELPLITEEFNGQQKRSVASEKESDELRGKAGVLLGNLNSMGRAYDFGSQLTPVCCRDQGNPIKYNKQPEDDMKVIRDEFHLLFTEICQLGFQLHKRSRDSDARLIFLKLMIALDIKSPGLVDGRKNVALLKMADFHRDTGDQDIHELILKKAAEAHGDSMPQGDPCLPLVTSLTETSKRADHDLFKLWKKHYMVDEETSPASLAIPPIQRSTQHRNPGVVSRLLDRPNDIAHSPPAMFNQEGLHIAATQGYEETLKNLLDAGAQVDALDLHKHTALFLAAAKGHKGCCSELIKRGANLNGRNIHGTTILEVAAGAGHINIVHQLVEAGAEVNPEVTCCTSTPLQAAVENLESPLEIALYLMSKNGDVSVPRTDGKNAIDLAEGRSEFLAHIMRQKEVFGPQGFFDAPQAFSFDQRHLDFGTSLP